MSDKGDVFFVVRVGDGCFGSGGGWVGFVEFE